jgi:uncharacterized metal-binding protein
MNCLSCNHKNCKVEAKDCAGTHDRIVEEYQDENARKIYSDADKLVAGGRAGELSRLDEIVEFCHTQGFRKIALAYCFGLEHLALETRDILKGSGLKVNSYRCTIGGLKEFEVDENLGKGVNCNPIGQAVQINSEKNDFVIEMGLCLGHDVLFHQHLKVPFTVFIVKDRVHNHNPAMALESYKK